MPLLIRHITTGVVQDYRPPEPLLQKFRFYQETVRIPTQFDTVEKIIFTAPCVGVYLDPLIENFAPAVDGTTHHDTAPQ